MGGAVTVPEIELSEPEVVRDPFTAYGRVRERSPLGVTTIPGIGRVWVLTRHEGARAMLGDPRFEIRTDSFIRPDVPADCLPYLRTMSEMNGPEHKRLRALVAPAFSVRRAEEFRPRIEPIVARLLDELPGRVEDGSVDLFAHVMRPLPMDVICELVGIPESDRPRWREYGAAVAAGSGPGFAAAVPGIVADAKAAIARRRAESGDDLLGDLVRAQAEDGDRLTDAEMVTLVWHLVIAGQTPTNFIANAVAALLSHPDQLAALRADTTLLSPAVDELIRWCGPALLTIPRFAREDVELSGEAVHKGEAAMASVAAVNRDPRAFADPDRLDVRRTGRSGHLGFGHGPHFCLGSAVARVQTEVALAALLRRFPDLAPAADLAEVRAPDPGTWRLTALPVTL
ncbi:MAG: cytochrome P450 [Streptosporangiales bacterium]|nr:cytochrome P450 [Streptosporangiales bacterium]